MEYSQFNPSPATRSFLACLWTLDTDSRDVQRIVPDGRPELIVHLGEPFDACHEGAWLRQPRCFLAGQLVEPLLVRSSGAGKVLAARFQPQGAARVFGAPMDTLAGAILPLELTCSTVAELETALLERLRPADSIVDAAVERLLDGSCDIAALASALHVSPRQLERRFKSAVGLSPKVFARIQRFQRVFREFESGGKWVETAIACGYYDQAHLIRDMREFAGGAPSAIVESEELARHFLSHFSRIDPPALA
jgi:AraC-like DNA-binding protein